MSENIVDAFIFMSFLILFLGGIAYIAYNFEEQEHRHKIELEKVKQGIFDSLPPKESFFKKYGKHILIILSITFLIIFICYIFKIPSDLAKYILEIIK